MFDLPMFEGIDIDSLEASDELFTNMALLNLFRPCTSASMGMAEPGRPQFWRIFWPASCYPKFEL
jgi:hypothetical protein